MNTRIRNTAAAALLALAGFTFNTTPAHAAGAADPTWGERGIARAAVEGGDAIPGRAALAPDGRIVVVGTAAASRGAAVARFDTQGRVDLRLQLPALDGEVLIADAVAVQPDGRIVVAGNRTAGGAATGFFATRLLPGGSIDESFGSAGTVRVALPGIGTLTGCTVERVLVLGSGRIWLLGHMSVLPAREARVAMLAALLPDGTPDGGVAPGGAAQVDPPAAGDTVSPLAAVFDAVETPDGVVVAGGRATFAAGLASPALVLARLDATTARVDTRFGNAGRVLRPGLPGEAWTSVVRLDDGRLVAAGTRVFPLLGVTPTPLRLNRFQADGLADASLVEPPLLMAQPVRVARGSTGSTGLWAAGTLREGAKQDFGLARLGDGGTPDAGFGTNGLLRLDAGSLERTATLLVQADGKPIVVGSSGTTARSFTAVRVDPAAAPPVLQGVLPR